MARFVQNTQGHLFRYKNPRTDLSGTELAGVYAAVNDGLQFLFGVQDFKEQRAPRFVRPDLPEDGIPV